MAGPDLSVVCRNCGSEVSPYVTECPYCGTRVRKRAPRLEREGDEIRIREGRREKKLRRDAERRVRAEERRGGIAPGTARREELSGKPLATIALLAIPAILYIVLAATGSVRGVVVTEATQAFIEIFNATFGDDPWRYLIAPVFFVSAGYLFICGVAIAIFLPPLERRLGSGSAFILAVACGVLGILAADGISSALGDGVQLAAGANGIALGALAAYVAIREPERRADPEDSYDPIAVGVAGIALLATPIFFSFADPWAGIVGGLVGGLCGFVATKAGRGAA
ncbi:MAG: rhomboid family intramembrane serine protease [Actinomycetota bacterium]|nr:rhomboid family intramembrane serine protease [Actinomycetota bacterium]